MTDRPIYMDHNATTPVHPAVVEAMLPYLTEHFGNPSSKHAYGRSAAAGVEAARSRVAELINADPSEIVFTAGATESDNMALRGVLSRRRGGHVITCSIEHEAVLETCRHLKEEGAEITVLPVDESGLIDPAAIRDAIRESTVLVSIQMANNEIGTIEPIAEIGAICREAGVAFHTDAVQGAGRIPIDVKRMTIDLMSLTAHKMYGPKGVGALYVREGLDPAPLLAGGGQEGGRRSGTLNVAGIVGFGESARIAMTDMAGETTRQAGLRDRLWEGIRKRIPDVSLNGHAVLRLPNNLNVAFAGIEAEALLTAMRDAAALSSGSACASGSSEGSYIIRALGKGAEAARCSLRFGLGRSNDEADIDTVVERLARETRRLREMAPLEPAARSGGSSLHAE